MNRDNNHTSDTKLLSEREKHLLTNYGSLPHKGLLGQQFQKRTYFDSGDFALSTADRVTDDGAIHTGAAHPLRESISHPYAAVPSSSNVTENANNDMHGKKSPILEARRSSLAEEMNIGNENSWEEK
ncbi:hypothetical protein BDV29DRAFT_161976 [Aspergillus leporis]|uniref:mRNA stability protein n=1 Tax=Aspergillus leporis TaxID=41062 RepID=A0A5N5WK21_9EURO|nr:hypothetical protein BDV29DRAFT_161976 [Aspergillus leporis]